MRTLTTALLALGLLSSPVIASAATAWTSASVNLRTGPSSDYPRIVTLPAGQRVELYGCIDDWSWCDVSRNGQRGWVSAGFLDYDQGGRRVAVNRHGAGLGVAVLDFVIGSYWDQHYRDKSWYGQRSRYEQRHPQHAGPAQPSRQPARNTATPATGDGRGQGNSRDDDRSDARPAARSSAQDRPQRQGNAQERKGDSRERDQDTPREGRRPR